MEYAMMDIGGCRLGIRQWKLPEYDPKHVEDLARETGYSALVCQILIARGFVQPEQILSFFQQEDSIEDAYQLADMEKAVVRIRQALENGERICVYGDYDCDGITATALLTSYLQSVGADVQYYVPSREKEGYGLNTFAIDWLASQQVDFIITVDNGISAHAEIMYAAALGIDVVVTDHHTPRETLPAAVAVINPHRADCPSAYKDLAGVGVAFKLICALEDAQGDELLEYYSDLVTLGTIADVVPLTGENRVIVRHGLAHIAHTQHTGILALMHVCGIHEPNPTSERLAFSVIPRINAAGRMDEVGAVLELLLTDDPIYAEEIAVQVNAQNIQRKQIEQEILAEIETLLAQNPKLLDQRVLILSGEGWHHGVVGIVSMRLVERYEKPCFVFSLNNGEARGSGRSIEGFSLIQAIAACSEHLTKYGGHTLAAGLSLPVEYLDAFAAQIQAFSRQNYRNMPHVELVADGSLSPEALTVENIASLDVLEPFGAENAAPLFHIAGLTIQGIYPTNDGKHLRVRFSCGNQLFYAVYFGINDQEFPYRPGEIVEIMARISVGEYNGQSRLSVQIQDLRLMGILQEQVGHGQKLYACLRGKEVPAPDAAEEILPSRAHIGLVYKYLRRVTQYPYGPDALYIRLMGSGIPYLHVRLALDILKELGFISCENANHTVTYRIIPDAPKADLGDSAILQTLMNMKAKTLVNNIERI